MGRIQFVVPKEGVPAAAPTVGHDIEHGGYNNAFLISTNDRLSLRYNDHSVLENHHASVAWGIISDSKRKT